MPNLEFLSTVVHHGIVLKQGMIVDDAQQDLALVAQNLIDRGLAQATDKPATHTAAVVNGAQEPLAKDSTVGGQTPNADADAAAKAAAKARQVAADAATANQVNDTATAESTPVVHAAAPTTEQRAGPTAADVEGI
jgi:hypothetical protein